MCVNDDSGGQRPDRAYQPENLVCVPGPGRGVEIDSP